jgi:hypothetical protein
MVMFRSAAVRASDRPPSPTPSVSRMATLARDELLSEANSLFAALTPSPMSVPPSASRYSMLSLTSEKSVVSDWATYALLSKSTTPARSSSMSAPTNRFAASFRSSSGSLLSIDPDESIMNTVSSGWTLAVPSDEVPFSGRSARKFDAQFRTSKTTNREKCSVRPVTVSFAASTDVLRGSYTALVSLYRKTTRSDSSVSPSSDSS